MSESDHGRGAGQDSETHRVSLSLMFAVEAQAGDLEWIETLCGWTVSLGHGALFGGGEVVRWRVGGNSYLPAKIE